MSQVSAYALREMRGRVAVCEDWGRGMRRRGDVVGWGMLFLGQG